MNTISQIQKQLREKLRDDIEQECWGIRAHDCLAEILADKWAGKKLNKRIADQFKEAFIQDPAAREKAVVYYSTEHGMGNLMVWGVGPWPDHSKRLMIFLGHDTEPTEPKYKGHYLGRVNPEGFEHADSPHGPAARERNRVRLELLNGDECGKMARAISDEMWARSRVDELIKFGVPGNEIRYFVQELVRGK